MKFKAFDYSQYNIDELIFVIESIMNQSIESICEQGNINIDKLISQDKNEINKLYDFAYSNDIDLNDTIWQLYQDEISSSSSIKLLAHGSRSGIRGAIRLDMSGDSNDFANGFYCGETFEQAGMFVSNETDSSLYMVQLNKRGLKAVRFAVTDDWLLAVAYYRDTLGDYANNPRVQRIIDKVNNADYIIAPIADNRMFELIDLFIAGKITNNQCKYSMSTSYLGYQYVFKTQKSVDNLNIINHCFLSDTEKAIYNKQLEKESKVSLNKVIFAKSKYNGSGKYINEILDNE